MKAWILSIGAAALLITVFGLLLPEGRTRKYVFGIMRIGLIVLVFIPILSVFTDTETYSSLFDSLSYKQEEYLPNDQNIFLCTLIESELTDKGIDCTVKTTTDERDDVYVDIYLKAPVINEKEGNIYKNSRTVTDVVEKYLPVGVDRIRVWAK